MYKKTLLLLLILILIIGLSIFGYEGKTHTDNFSIDNSRVYIVQDFEENNFPPTGWTLEGSTTNLWLRSTNCSGYGSGTASAEANFYLIYSGTQSLITQTFSSTVTGDSLKFDHAYCTFSTEIDQLQIYTSSNGGTSWNLFITLYGGVSGELVTAPPQTSSFVPTASQWATKKYALPNGTNKIMFTAVSAYGNNLYVDNIKIGNPVINDVGVESIDIPLQTQTGSQIPKAKVRNYGTVTQTSFPVNMTITPGNYSSTKIVTNLSPGSNYQVNFDSWNPGTGTYSVRVVTQLSGDQNRTNDTMRATILALNPLRNCGWTSRAPLIQGRSSNPTAFIRSGTYPNDTGYIYVIGGLDESGNPVTTNYKFNTRTNIWNPASQIPIARFKVPAVVVKNKIYIISGFIASNVLTGRVDIYNPLTDSWTTGTNIPVAVTDYAAGVYKDSLIYIIGGFSGLNNENLVQIYNVYSNTWMTGTSKPGTAVSGLRGGIAGNTIIIAGGYAITPIGNLNNAYKGVINANSPSTIVWSSISNYPVSASDLAAGTPVSNSQTLGLSSNYVFFTGGTSLHGSSQTLKSTFAFDIPENQWKLLPQKITGVNNICNFVSVIKTDSVFMSAIGGYDGLNESPVNEWLCLGTGIVLNISSSGQIPSEYKLFQNYPNPFNSVTNIRYQIPSDGFVILKVYDILGKEVTTLVNEYKQAGIYYISLNASDLSSGIYLYKIVINGFTAINKMILMK